MKICSKCGVEKELNMFYKDKQKATGYRPDCKECNAKTTTSYAKKSRNKVNSNNIKYKTGLSSQDYNQLLKQQNRKCAICSISIDSYHKAFSVDHCHTEGFIRGLLCNTCNVGLGYFKDNIELLRSAIDYLRNSSEIKDKIKYGNKNKRA